MSEIINYVFGQNIMSANNDVLRTCHVNAIVLVSKKWTPNENIIRTYNAVEIKISELSKIKFKLREKEEKLKMYENDVIVISNKPEGASKNYEMIEINRTVELTKHEIDGYKNFINEWGNNEKVNGIISKYKEYYNSSKKYLTDNNLSDLLFFGDIMTSERLNYALNKAVTNLYYNYDQKNAIQGLIKLDECFYLSAVKQTIRGNFLTNYKEEYYNTIKFKLNVFGNNIINSKASFKENEINVSINNTNVKFEYKGNGEYEMNIDETEEAIEVD
jgi:hypothetical protein